MITYRDRVARVLPVLISLGLFLAALDVLRLELGTVTWPELSAAVTAIPARNLALSLVLTLLNYVVLAATTCSPANTLAGGSR
jgi:hypothetical protein